MTQTKQPCDYCGERRLFFVRRMTNVDKYLCKACKRPNYFSIRDSQGNMIPNPPSRVSRGAGARRVQRNAPIVERDSFVCYNHQSKGVAYVDALTKLTKYKYIDTAGEIPPYFRELSFVLTDSDILGRSHRLKAHKRHGAKGIFLIPHTARPNIVNDISGGCPDTTAQFVVSQGHIDVIRRYGYTKPMHAVGWSLCPIKEFKPRQAPRNIVFAPIHPRCSEIDKQANRDTFERLRKLAVNDTIKLTVRFINSLALSGLERVEHENITYVPGRMNQDYSQIDEADVVVAHQTYAWLAVARGVPTVMMAEDMPTHIEPRGKPVQYARNWDKYKDLLMYPLDILATKDTLGLLTRATKSDKEISDWRSRMIGEPFDGKKFVDIIAGYVG